MKKPILKLIVLESKKKILLIKTVYKNCTIYSFLNAIPHFDTELKMSGIILLLIFLLKWNDQSIVTRLGSGQYLAKISTLQ